MVRLALGDRVRNAMTLRDFDALIEEKTGRRIHASELSRIERHERPALIEDAEAIAKVDPLGRSPAWLIWGHSVELPGPQSVDPAPQNGHNPTKAPMWDLGEPIAKRPKKKRA